KRLGTIGEGCNLVWGGHFNDSDHLEYHPNWSGGAGGKLLMKFHDWAVKAAAAAEDGSAADWVKYFWWAAGAGSDAPMATFLKTNPVPK
ncbi:MAG: hypothetical protein JWQ71_142, partial [Pedosphaera sp.]|nr:hypothetical protein [Pedosphaera sp.]